MKRSYINRGTKELARTGFKQKKTVPLQRTKLAKKSKSDVALTKERIQALLRKLVIERDGGCILRHYPEAGECGGYRKDGELILQFDHLNSRVHSISYADPRLGVCLCQRHHIFWKKQEPDLFTRLVRDQIGKQRADLLDRVQEDRTTHRKYAMDWKLEEIALKKQLGEI